MVSVEVRAARPPGCVSGTRECYMTSNQPYTTAAGQARETTEKLLAPGKKA